MGNRRQDRRARKLRRKRIPLLRTPSPQLAADIQADRAELELFISLRWFDKLIREIKKNLYHKPQNVIKKPNYDNRVVR